MPGLGHFLRGLVRDGTLELHCGAMRCLLSKHLICIAGLAAFASGALGQDTGLTQIKERELEEVRAQISRLKRSMDKRALDRDRITGELQAAEVKISETRLHLKELERQRDFSQKKKVELDARIEVKGAELKAELMTYYRYLSEFRGDNIEAVNGHIRELSDLSEQMVAEEKRLAGLARAYTAELNEVSTAQEKRQGLLSALQSKINEEGSEIERLAAQERDLARLITELTSILSDYPITSEEPFSDFKGRLTWPIAGSLLHDFGQPRAAGPLKWNGVVLAAPRGREIRAIYHGRVIFADWLAGMGLLVIVDHGGGYMSLYGYNETTLKIAGDWVAPGDVIATVGNSGGQARSGLYFEIRQGTKPLNPRSWVSKQPSAN